MTAGLKDDIQTEAEGVITFWSLHNWLMEMADEKRVERNRRHIGKRRTEELKREEFFYRYIADSLMTARRNDHAVVIEEIATFIEARMAGLTSLSSAVRERFLDKGISNEVKRKGDSHG